MIKLSSAYKLLLERYDNTTFKSKDAAKDYIKGLMSKTPPQKLKKGVGVYLKKPVYKLQDGNYYIVRRNTKDEFVIERVDENEDIEFGFIVYLQRTGIKDPYLSKTYTDEIYMGTFQSEGKAKRFAKDALLKREDIPNKNLDIEHTYIRNEFKVIIHDEERNEELMRINFPDSKHKKKDRK